MLITARVPVQFNSPEFLLLVITVFCPDYMETSYQKKSIFNEVHLYF